MSETRLQSVRTILEVIDLTRSESLRALDIDDLNFSIVSYDEPSNGVGYNSLELLGRNIAYAGHRAAGRISARIHGLPLDRKRKISQADSRMLPPVACSRIGFTMFADGSTDASIDYVTGATTRSIEFTTGQNGHFSATCREGTRKYELNPFGETDVFLEYAAAAGRLVIGMLSTLPENSNLRVERGVYFYK